MKNLQTILTLSALIMSAYANDAECNDRQILSNGECQNCPTWTRAQSNNSYCNSDQCDHKTQVVQTDGTCDSCPEGYEPDVNMVDCNKIGLECEGNTARSGDKCLECPTFTRPQSNNSYCSPDYCDIDSIVLPSGKCTKCEEGTKPDLIWRRECVVSRRNQVCNDRQISLKDHHGLTTCEDCPDFTRAQEQNWYCAADMCDFNQIIQKDGSCLSCPKTQTPDASRLKCKPMPTAVIVGPGPEPAAAPAASQAQEENTSTSCQPSWQIQLEDGTCVACPEFTRPQADGECGPDICSRNEFLHEWGYCLPCPSGEVHDRAGRKCSGEANILAADFEPAECGEREHRSIDGLECYQCPDYTRAQDKNTRCAGDKCENHQIQKADGTCSDCPEGTRPNFMQRNCVEIVSHTSCTHRQIYVEVMNMCEECPTYTRPRGDYCAADKCADNQRLLEDGTCSGVQCGELEIKSQDGVSCEKCYPYTRPQDNGTRCGQDSCPKGIIQFDGTCMDYGDYYTNLKVVKNPQEDGSIVQKEGESSSTSVVVIGVLAAVIIGLVAFILFKFRAQEKPQQPEERYAVRVSEVETARVEKKAEPEQNGPTGQKLNASFDKVDAEVPQERVEDSVKVPIQVNE